MAKVSAVRIKNITGGGSVEGGTSIFFNILFEDGQTDTFVCDLVLLPLFLGNLTAYANIAEGERLKRSGRQTAAGAPYIVTEVFRSGHTTDGKRVMVEMNTEHGFPLQIAMTFDQAAQTIEFLQREMLLAGKDVQSDLN